MYYSWKQWQLLIIFHIFFVTAWERFMYEQVYTFLISTNLWNFLIIHECVVSITIIYFVHVLCFCWGNEIWHCCQYLRIFFVFARILIAIYFDKPRLEAISENFVEYHHSKNLRFAKFWWVPTDNGESRTHLGELQESLLWYYKVKRTQL
jgi:hypothetical protein